LQLLFTLSRAALLVYFFEAARKPLWLACIVGWIGWEIYVVLRHTGRERDARGAAQGENAQNAVPGGNGAALVGGEGQMQARGAAGQPNAGAPATATAGVTDISRFIDRIANINLANESLALKLAIREPGSRPPVAAASERPSEESAPPERPREQERPQSPTGSPTETADHLAAVEPSLVHRTMTFIALFFISLFPVIWDRRRARFREREAWVREMFEVGRPDPDVSTAEGAPPAPNGPEEGRRRREGLNGWRKAYVDRVISGQVGEDVEF